LTPNVDHKALLHRYNPDGKAWTSIADDGYLYDHLAYHLLEAGRLDELYQFLLASPEWMEVRTAQSSMASYIADLDLVINWLGVPTQSSDLLILIQLHTARLVAHTQNEIIEDSSSGNSLKQLMLMERDFRLDNLTSALAEIGLNAKAAACAATIEDNHLQTSAIEEIVEILLKQQRFTDIAETISLIPNEQARNWMRCQWVIELIHLKRSDDIEAVVQTITDGWLRSRALSYQASFLSQENQQSLVEAKFTEAENTAKAIQNLKMRSRALRDLAGGLAQAAQFDHAVAIAHQIQREKERSEALGLIAAALAQANQPHKALTLIDSISQRESALLELLETYLKNKRFEHAYEIVHSIPSENERQWALQKVALQQIADGQLLEAQRTVEQIDPDPYPRYEVTAELITALVRSGQAEKALEIAQRIKDTNWQTYVLNKLAVDLAQSQQSNLFDEVIDQLKHIIENIPEGEEKNSQLYFLAVTLIRSSCFDDGQLIINQLKGSQALANDWNYLFYAFVEMGQWHKALRYLVARDPVDYLRILSGLSLYFEQIEPQFTLGVLREVTRITSWILPNWQEIHSILAEPLVTF
jgi:hypothetical protein